jgi:DNA repair protein RecN (Recombination protein N)
MLKGLYIENYALIEKLEIEFNKGLSIITGETGAGKSILLGALSLILGKRADTDVLFDKSKKCIVEGVYDISGYDLEGFFRENDLDYEKRTILRREIGANGKSRAFINDTPVNLNILRELALQLVDIHSQHQSLELNNNEFQLKVVDAFAGNNSELMNYKSAYQQFKKVKAAYKELEESARQSKADYDYWQYQYTQLQEAGLQANEQEELEKELEQLNHAGEIKTNLTGALQALYDDEQSVVNQLNQIKSLIARINRYLPGEGDLLARLESSYIELKDIATELGGINESVSMDPQRQGFVSERLDLIYSLQQKHKVTTLDELLKIKDELQQKLEDIDEYDSKLIELKKQQEQSRKAVEELADALSKKRCLSFPKFEAIIMSLLSDMGMPGATFKIGAEKTDDFTGSGTDQIRFLFNANKNAGLLDISKVASGGELSRLMLSIKSLLSDSTGLPTIILDEIDSGVSGEVADKVGNIIKKMSGSMQVLNITHLPQVASKGDFHYLVYKEDDENASRTFIKLLSPKERETEIAKMLSGESLTGAAIQNARELLNN